MNLVSFRTFLKFLSCLLPELRLLPAGWNVLLLSVLSPVNTVCLNEGTQRWKVLISEEAAAQHSTKWNFKQAMISLLRDFANDLEW